MPCRLVWKSSHCHPSRSTFRRLVYGACKMIGSICCRFWIVLTWLQFVLAIFMLLIGSMFCHILSASQSWLTLLVIGVFWVLFFVGQNFKMAEACKQPSRKSRRSCRSDNLKTTKKIHIKSGRWFQIFLDFHPCLRKIPFLTNIFQVGWNHQLEMFQKVIFVTSAAALVSDLFQISVLELMLRMFPKIGGTPKWMVYNGKPY